MNILTAFFEKLGPEMASRTLEHIYLTCTAILIAASIAFPLGIFLARCKRTRIISIVLGAVSVIQTVPSLALIAFIVLLFALISLPTIGMLPALLALVLYALLPILQNTYTGIQQVDPALKEVAMGMGMKPRQILLTVELPLALPVIIAGIRIAAVWTIGVATLCGLIGAGGLGDLILKGLRSIQMDYLLAGTLPATLLALIFNGALGKIEKWLAQKRHNPESGHKFFSSSMGYKLLTGMVILFFISLPVWNYTSSTGGMRSAFEAEFLTRPDGYRGLIEHYGFRFSIDPMHMDPGLMYRAIADKAVDVICGYSTDGRIPAYNLQILIDDRKFFPPYYAAVLIREEAVLTHPHVVRALNSLGGQFTDDTMQRLNFQVDELGRTARDVAAEFLFSGGFISSADVKGNGSAGSIVIGSKPFTEQEILSEIMARLLEWKTDYLVERKLNLGGTMICFNALRAGDVDLYAEYTGTGLASILKDEIITDPGEAFRYVKETFYKKYRMVWLEPFGFNNTYTLTMRREHAGRLGIQTISDLAEYIKNQ